MLRLTEKKAVFVREYASNGFKQTEAYLTAYGTKKRTVASTESSKLMKDPDILTAIEIEIGSNKRLSWELGLDRKTIMKALKKIITGTKKETITDAEGNAVEKEKEYDTKSVIAAITTLAKLTGDFKEDGINVNNFMTKDSGVDFSKVKDPEKMKKIIAKIHSELNKQ
jgi:phage terminase small subunit